MFDHISYDPTSPTFLRFNRNWGCKTKAGDTAGSIKHDRIEVSVFKKSYNGARVVWELCKGEPVPSGFLVVPVDGNPHNLNIDNLVLLTRSQQRTFCSMVKGQGKRNIHFNQDGSMRVYFIQRKGEETIVETVGKFDNLEEAQEAYRRRQMAEILFGSEPKNTP